MGKKARMYAKALSEVLDKASDVKIKRIVKTFALILKRRGDLKLAASIMQEFERAQSARKGKIGEVITAKLMSKDIRSKAQASIKKQGLVFKESINPALIGGTAVFLGNEILIDNSVQGKLKKLWLNLR